MAMVSIDRSMHGSLREEVQLLRRRVVSLETAEADNEKLRKELSKLQNVIQEEKAQLELDFMNQLTGVARENALNLEELNGRLAESSNVNRALSEEHQNFEPPEMVNKRIRAIESNHKTELATVIDNSKEEVERLQKHLYIIQSSRDEVTEKLDETKLYLELKEKEVASLHLKVFSNRAGSSASQGSDKNASASGSIQKMLKQAHEENAKVKSSLRSLEREMSEKSNLYQSETQILQERLSSRDSEMNAKLGEIQKLESELAKKKDSVPLQLRGPVKGSSLDLTNALQKAETGKKRLEVSLAQSERSNKELKVKCQWLERSNVELREENEVMKRGGDISTRDSTGSSGMPASEEDESPAQPNSYQKRTTQIIRKLEQNLKREGQLKQNVTAGLKNRKLRPEVDENVDSLRTELGELKQKLEKEKDHTINLKREIKEMKGTQQRSSLPYSPSKSKLPTYKAASNQEKELDRVTLAKGKLATNLSVVTNLPVVPPSRDTQFSPRSPTAAKKKHPLNHELKPSPRTPVRGIVETYERRISKTCPSPKNDSEPPAIARMTDFPGVVQMRSAFESKDMEDLKYAVQFERMQVVELEQELTRQCEINCSLLKEISSLASETETSRSKHSHHFENRCLADQNEIDKLSAELSTLKSQLSLAEESKSRLAKKLETASSEDRKQIERLTSELSSLKSKISRAEESRSSISKKYERTAATDKQEMDLLKLNVQQLQTKLEEAEGASKELQDRIASDREELDRRRKAIDDFEQSGLEGQQEVQMHQSRVEVLESELAKFQELQSTYTSRQEEIDGLNSLVEALQTNLANADDHEAALEKEKEAGGRLDSLVQDLKEQLTESERTAATDKKEIDLSKLMVHQLQTKLEEAEGALKELQDKSASDREELDQRRKVIDDFEQSGLEGKEEVLMHRSRVEELESELAKFQDLQSTYASRQDEIDGLNSLVEALQTNLANADETEAALEKEKEAGGRLDSLVRDLKEQLTDSEQKCETLSKDYSHQSLTDKEEVQNLRSQVEKLVVELGKTTESRDELEANDRVQQEKFKALQTDLEQKLKGLDDSHGADQEAIGRLHEQVQALQQELSDTLVVVENLKGQMQQKEEVQDTVEELTRENQQSLDGEINKLRTELTNVQVAKSETEADYKKRVQGLEDMIDSMQVEIDETLEEKEREVEDLKLKVEDKEARINRLTKEKEQLVLSMNDMTSSRRDEIDELQSELMGMSTRAANQAREVQSFKLQIEESSYRKEEIERLRARVRELTDQLSSRDGTRMHERTALEVENSELRRRLRQASVERQTVEDKLREYVSEQKGGSSKSVQVLRERNAALKFEVEKLTKKLRKVAVQKHVVDSKAASSKAASTNVEAIRFMI